MSGSFAVGQGVGTLYAWIITHRDGRETIAELSGIRVPLIGQHRDRVEAMRPSAVRAGEKASPAQVRLKMFTAGVVLDVIET